MLHLSNDAGIDVATAVLFVTGGKKLDAAAEEAIKAKLKGRSLAVKLTTSEVDSKQALTDRASVEAKIMKALCKLAPDLSEAKKLDFRKSIDAAGNVKLLVKTENQAPYPCILQLKAPPTGKPLPGVHRMEDLVQCEFDDVMASRALWIEVSYEVFHADAAKIVQNCNAVLAKVERDVAQRITGLIEKTVVKLNDGLASAGSKAMDYEMGEKLVDQLNRDIQRQIDGVYKESEARLAATEGKSVPGGIKVDVVARVDKFRLHNNLAFPGGSPPAVDEKSIKNLVKYCGQINSKMKVFGEVASAVNGFSGQYEKLYAEAKKAPGAEGKPEQLAEAISPDIDRPRKQLSTEMKRLQSEIAAASGHMLDLTKVVNATIKKHGASAPKSPDALKDHKKVATHLKKVQDRAADLRKLAMACAKRVDTAAAVLEKSGPLLPPGVEQVMEATEKGVLRSLTDAADKLESTCKKVAAELKD